MKTYQSFLLISADSLKRIDATEALAHLLLSSSISRDAKRDWDLKIRTREMMTSFSGLGAFGKLLRKGVAVGPGTETG